MVFLNNEKMTSKVLVTMVSSSKPQQPMLTIFSEILTLY